MDHCPFSGFSCVSVPWRYLGFRRPFLIMWSRVAGSWWRSSRRFCIMTPMTSSKKALSSKVAFASLTQNNLGTVRKLNSVLFPIKYSEKFYSEILLPEVEDFCKLSVYQLLCPPSLVSETNCTRSLLQRHTRWNNMLQNRNKGRH